MAEAEVILSSRQLIQLSKEFNFFPIQLVSCLISSSFSLNPYVLRKYKQIFKGQIQVIQINGAHSGAELKGDISGRRRHGREVSTSLLTSLFFCSLLQSTFWLDFRRKVRTRLSGRLKRRHALIIHKRRKVAK